MQASASGGLGLSPFPYPSRKPQGDRAGRQGRASHASPARGVRVVSSAASWPLRPESLNRGPDATDGGACGTGREAATAGFDFVRRHSYGHRAIGSAPGSSPLPSARLSTRGTQGWRIMTSRQRKRPVRRPREPSRGGIDRRLSSAINARRRLDARRPDSPRTSGPALGRSGPRPAYLTRSHD